MYLMTSNNKRVITQLHNFLQAILIHGAPSRVRGDHGGENSLIAQWMIDHVGPNRHSFISSSSKHNTRIERLWRATKCPVSTSVYFVIQSKSLAWIQRTRDTCIFYSTCSYPGIMNIIVISLLIVTTIMQRIIYLLDVAENAELLNLNETNDINDIPLVELGPIG